MDTAARMSDPPSGKEMERLRALVPLHTLPEEALAELVEGATFESVAKGKLLIQQGDTDQKNVYLLKGSVALLSDKAVIERIRAGSDTARFPLAHQLPRKHSVRAESAVQIVRIDSRRLSDLLAHTHTVDYQVADFDAAAEDDWMGMLLQSRILQQVPAANIQQVMINVEQVEVAAGEDLIRQGDPGDFYYMLMRGHAVVRRDNDDGKGPCDLATLGPGDAFGEEALLSDAPRNSSVTMLEDGEVLRLAKEHFLQLMHNPLLDRLDMQAAQARVDQGAIWLDLRSSEEYDESHLPGAINYPFESLRYQSSNLSPDQHYVLYSNTGGRAMAGAFLLLERDFDVSILEGGTLQQDQDAVAAAEIDLAGLSALDDSAMQQRMREVEARARELERRLKQTQQDQENEAAERQRQLQEVNEAVDQARRELIETEEQKREALAAQEKAYAEMERLTSSLEELQSERTSLVDRMSEIEGLDKQLQARLAKAERELIGERERAESATSSLEELSQRLNEVLEKREHEREQHARERGELKEEMTALQLDLEQAELDMQELHDQLAEHQAGNAAEGAVLEDLRQRLADAQAAGEAATAARDALQGQVEALNAQLEQTQAAQDQLAELRREFEVREQAALEATEQHQARLEALAAERDALAQRLAAADEQAAQTELANNARQQETAAANSALEAELEAARHQLARLQTEADEQQAASRRAAEELRERLQGELEAAQRDAQQRVAALQAELEQLRTDNAALQSELASGGEAAGAAIGQAQARVAELETSLDEVARKTEEQLAAKQAELESAGAQLQALEARAQQDQAALSELQAALDAQQGALLEARQAREAAQAGLDQARAEQAALQSQLASGDEQAAAALAQAQARVAELEQAIDAARTELETSQAALAEARQQAAGRAESEAEFERLQTQAGELEDRLEEQARHAAEELAAKQQELDTLHAATETAIDAAVAQLRDEITELAQRLEERELALTTAREQQSELIDALNAASAERETLQLAVGDKDDEEARLTDLENQVAAALREQQDELLAHQQAQQRLREQLAEEGERRRALQEEVDRLNGLIESLDEGGRDEDGAVRAERDSLATELALRESEVEQLRGVLEEYVDQIRAAQSGDGDASETAALRSELEMVREQAIRDVAQMREKLAAAETQNRRLQQADGREAISHEAMRQRIEGLESSLSERQRELADATDTRHVLEDSLEDVNRRIDDLRRELEQAQAEAVEAASMRREAENARDQLHEALRRLQDDAEEARVTDLRDERLQPGRRPIGGGNAVTRRLAPGLIGAALLFGALEAVSIGAGKGELLSLLLRMSGQ